MIKQIRKLKLIERNKLWLTAPINLKDKVLYYPNASLAFSRTLAGRTKKINYLGGELLYDSIYAPLSLQAYPKEIQRIISNSDNKLKRVLDIGGNIGQFSITLGRLSANSHIDVFEPNPLIFPLLRKNITRNKKIRAFNYGIGPSKKTNLSFVEGKSATASLFSQNASDDKDHLRVIEVALTSDICKLTGTRKYDLIKIDVEGYEFDVLKYLQNIQTRYLFVEVSGLGRYKNYNHSQLLDRVRRSFGSYDLSYTSGMNSKSNTCEMLFSFKPDSK